jgi:hypothetical protein
MAAAYEKPFRTPFRYRPLSKTKNNGMAIAAISQSFIYICFFDPVLVDFQRGNLRWAGPGFLNIWSWKEELGKL